MSYRPVRLLLYFSFAFLLSGFTNSLVNPPTVEPSHEQLLSGKPFIYRIEPEPRGGQAYKMIYIVPVPIEVFWRFKTDFHGDFVSTNKYVEEQTVIREEKNLVIIENKLTNQPGTRFRWLNILHPRQHRLEFVLENPNQSGQRFHYGYFQLEPFGPNTKVSHAAYFDFFGASLWATFPWQGGMHAFLDYIARWEQKTIVKVKNDYNQGY